MRVQEIFYALMHFATSDIDTYFSVCCSSHVVGYPSMVPRYFIAIDNGDDVISHRWSSADKPNFWNLTKI